MRALSGSATSLKASQAYIGKEPPIPVTYLSSIPEGYDVNNDNIPEYDKKILRLQKRTFSGSHPADTFGSTRRTSWSPRSPKQNAGALQRVIAEAGY